VSRVINPQSGARRRTKLIKQMGLALRHAASGEAGEATQRDVFAFLALSLKEVCISVDETVDAWEKRDYWVKADRFRMEWSWAEKAERELTASLEKGDLLGCASAAANLAGQVQGVKLPKKLPTDRPWAGAWSAWSDAMAAG